MIWKKLREVTSSSGKMRLSSMLCFILIIIGTFLKISAKSRLSLWLDEQQVYSIAQATLALSIIDNGRVQKYLTEEGLESSLPVLPPEVETVNLTWEAGDEMFNYWFDNLESKNLSILYNPLLSIPAAGIIPKGPKIFQMSIPCTGNVDGVATLVLGLRIFNRHSMEIKGSPIKLSLRKQCYQYESTNLCKKSCKNGGRCNHVGYCECKQGYRGQYCELGNYPTNPAWLRKRSFKDMCHPKCQNNGTCISKNICLCLEGFSGQQCEKALCKNPCQNGGRCVKSIDVCWCTSGFIGNACEYSQCTKGCLNGGLCIGPNKCSCRAGFTGDLCETGVCLQQCLNGGSCIGNNKCSCKVGYSGYLCEKGTDRSRRTTSKTSKKCERRKRNRLKKRCDKIKKCKPIDERLAQRCSALKGGRLKKCERRQTVAVNKCVKRYDKRTKRCKKKQKEIPQICQRSRQKAKHKKKKKKKKKQKETPPMDLS